MTGVTLNWCCVPVPVLVVPRLTVQSIFYFELFATAPQSLAQRFPLVLNESFRIKVKNLREILTINR